MTMMTMMTMMTILILDSTGGVLPAPDGPPVRHVSHYGDAPSPAVCQVGNINEVYHFLKFYLDIFTFTFPLFHFHFLNVVYYFTFPF